MKIRTRLTILFTIITATILLAFAATVYWTAKESREKEFYLLLKKEAITKANLSLNANMDKKTLQDIYRNNRKILNEVEVAIYDDDFNLIYHDAVDIDYVKETKAMLSEIKNKKEIQFYQGEWQVIGLRYNYNNQDFMVTATALDQYGYTKLDKLFNTMIIAFFASILVIYFMGRFFARKAFEPVKVMTDKAALISASNLDLRLISHHSQDELAELACTFNEMLDRLESSFDSQKNFVSNISHELRTPLSAIITELELSMDKERSISEYKRAIQLALFDSRRLVKLFNSLLDLAKASYDPSEIAFKPVRIDELLLDARQQVQQTHGDYHVSIHFENEMEDDHQISIIGNEYLLKVAFVNLLENGCKFSKDKHCKITIQFAPSKIILQFIDQGIGIAKEDFENLYTAFYRGSNKDFADGNGIGLSLTQKIITLHHGSIAVQSEYQKGTIFTVKIPILQSKAF